MNGALARYLRGRLSIQILGLLVALTALMQVLELLDVTTDVLDRGLGLRGLVHYAMLRTPSEVVVALPLAVLLGTVSAFHAMARQHEITAMRAAGVSLGKLYLWLLPVPLALAAAHFALGQAVLPQAETELKRWWDATTPVEDIKVEPLWAHTRSGPVSFEHGAPDGRSLRHVRIYELADDGRLRGRILADAAQWQNGQWRLESVRELRLTGHKLMREELDHRLWNSNLRPDDVTRLELARPQLSSMMLADTIAGSRVGTQPLRYYKTVLYRSFTAPFGAFVMLLLAVPSALALPRGGGGSEMLTGLGLGLAFMLCDGLVAALGSGGQLPPLFAALAAPLLFITIGLLRVRARDRL